MFCKCIVGGLDFLARVVFSGFVGDREAGEVIEGEMRFLAFLVKYSAKLWKSVFRAVWRTGWLGW